MGDFVAQWAEVNLSGSGGTDVHAVRTLVERWSNVNAGNPLASGTCRLQRRSNRPGYVMAKCWATADFRRYDPDADIRVAVVITGAESLLTKRTRFGLRWLLPGRQSCAW